MENQKDTFNLNIELPKTVNTLIARLKLKYPGNSAQIVHTAVQRMFNQEKLDIESIEKRIEREYTTYAG